MSTLTSFHLSRVRLLDSDFKNAQEVALEYLLSLDVDRLLAPFRREAGLPVGAPAYGGWESDGLDGHIGGHFISACSQLYAATGDTRLGERLDYALSVLAECQSAGEGYLGGIPGGRQLGAELSAGTIDADVFTLNGRWVPLYNLHKTFAGLIDAYIHARKGSALPMLIALADWWCGVSRDMDDGTFERVLRAEFGGMNEVFAVLAEITGRPDYLREAHRFSHRAILGPLVAGQDPLDGLHANTQIPKVVGYAKLAELTEDPALSRAVEFFWETVTSRRTVSIGGNSVREHFHSPEDFLPMASSEQGPETCNTYNMLKLAKLRYERHGDPSAIDFYERATYNHILSSQHPGRGGFVYFTPMRPAHYRVYSKAQESMWCCVGSGLENHARYGEFIYSKGPGDLYVNLYIPSELDWEEHGIRVRLDTSFPYADSALLSITAAAPTTFTLHLRRPGWATFMEVDVDGQLQPNPGEPTIAIQRTWQGTTTVSVRIGAEIRCEPLPDHSPDHSGWVSVLYGPIVLAQRNGTQDVADFEAANERMGHVASGPKVPLAQTPIVSARHPAASVSLIDRGKLIAKMAAELNGHGVELNLEPFAGIHDERYTIYWPTGAIPSERTVQLAALEAEENNESDVVDVVAAGEQQPESEHGFAGNASQAGSGNGLRWRNASGWFSYALTGVEGTQAVVRVRFRETDPGENRAHELRLNGVPVPAPERSWKASGIHFQEFALPAGSSDPLTFSVHALPGCVTGDLLSVELRRATALDAEAYKTSYPTI